MSEQKDQPAEQPTQQASATEVVSEVEETADVPVAEAPPVPSGGATESVADKAQAVAGQVAVEPVTAAPDQSIADASPPDITPPVVNAEAGAETSGGAGPVAAQDAPKADGEKKKRRRRRRRKKKDGASATEAEAAAAVDGKQKPGSEKKDRKVPTVPFVRFFQGDPSQRQHAFAAGELVAGRVSAVLDQAIVIDLFGKATAVMDRFEPVEIEPLPEPLPAEKGTEKPSGDPSKAADAASTNTASTNTASTGETASANDTAPENDASSESARAPASAAQTDSTGDSSQDSVVVMPSITISDVPPAADMVSDQEAMDAAAEVEAEVDADEADEVASEDGAKDQVDAKAADQPEALTAENVGPLPKEPEGDVPPAPEVGSIVRGRVGSVSESGNIAIVNRAIDRGAAKQELANAGKIKRRVRGVVFGFNRGGFDVLANGIRVFCPANGMTLETVSDPNDFVGQALDFTIPPRKGKAKGIVVSRRTLLEREARKRRKAVLKALEVGKDLKGKVTQVREYGAFVDVGDGLEGMVHQSELSWTHGVRPADVVKPGDEIDVRVLEIKRDPKRLRNSRISLSAKALLPDPWDSAKELLKEGSHTQGTVVGTAEFGAFVRIAEGIEGLLHVSELGKDIAHANQAVKEGDEINVIVERVDRKQRRISLSKISPQEAKAIEDGTFDLSKRPKSLKAGSHVTVVIQRVDHAGIHVRVAGVLGKKGRGFISGRDLGSYSSAERKRNLTTGAELEVKITGTDRSGSLRCSVKGLENDAERQAVRDYKKESAKQGFGTFGDLLRAKLDTTDSPSE